MNLGMPLNRLMGCILIIMFISTCIGGILMLAHEMRNIINILEAQIKFKNKIIIKRIEDIEDLEFEIKKRVGHNDLLVKTNYKLRLETEKCNDDIKSKALSHFSYWYGKGKRFEEFKKIMDGKK